MSNMISKPKLCNFKSIIFHQRMLKNLYKPCDVNVLFKRKLNKEGRGIIISGEI